MFRKYTYSTSIKIIELFFIHFPCNSLGELSFQPICFNIFINGKRIYTQKYLQVLYGINCNFIFEVHETNSKQLWKIHTILLGSALGY